MTEKEDFKLTSLILREIDDFEREMLGKDSEYLFENAREIYATKFIGDCLVDYNFLKDKDYNLFPKENVLRSITELYLRFHDEISESDLSDMFTEYETQLKKFANCGSEM